MLDSAKIKRQWLIAFILMVVINWLSYAAAVFLSNLSSDKKIVCIFVFAPLMIAISRGFIYYCAYKKGGTKLLGFQMFAAPLYTLVSVCEEIKKGADIQQTLIGATIMLPVLIFYLTKSYSLYQLNKANKQQNDNELVKDA